MRNYLILLISFLISCKANNNTFSKSNSSPTTANSSEYKLIKAENQNGLLILFPCYPCDFSNTLAEFNIVDVCIQNGISILAMNFNQHLYLTFEEKQNLATNLEMIIHQYNLAQQNIIIGGFSSGGNVSLLLSNYLIENNSKVQPKGVFVVDSPIDLLGLYKVAEKNIKLNFSEVSVQEATWIINFLKDEFGNPDEGLENFEKASPYTLETQNISNLIGLKNVKLRIYTEPDVQWWYENRRNDYEDLNAYFLENLYKKLSIEFGKQNLEFIKTTQKGFRSNGERHPHSWSIVNSAELVEWILNMK